MKSIKGKGLIRSQIRHLGSLIWSPEYFSDVFSKILPFFHRAQIYRESGDVTMAIVNFTQAIKLDPEDYEAYYQRAEMYEKVSARIFS